MSKMAEQGLSISLSQVCFGYGEAGVSFDLTVEPAAMLALTGPSGSGKTTLLNLIAGFLAPDSGTVRIGMENVTDLPPSRRPVTFLFQDNNLFSHLSVADNVGLGISPALRLTSADHIQISASLERLGILELAKRLPGALSGGERQRAALARALVQNNPVLLLDEPFASLGPGLRQELTGLVGELHKEKRMTALIATHQPAELLSIADAYCFLEAGQVREYGPLSGLRSDGASPALRVYLGERGQIS